MGISGALYNAASGLAAAARLADTVSNNVSNAQTAGYARRTTELSSLSLGGYGSGVRAFSGPFCSGDQLFRNRITEQGDRSQTRVGVGAIGSGFRIASMRVEFGDSSDSAALDSLCFEPTGSRITVEDGRVRRRAADASVTDNERVDGSQVGLDQPGRGELVRRRDVRTREAECEQSVYGVPESLACDVKCDVGPVEPACREGGVLHQRRERRVDGIAEQRDDHGPP